MVITAWRIQALSLVNSPDITYSKSYLGLLSIVGGFFTNITCCIPSARPVYLAIKSLRRGRASKTSSSIPLSSLMQSDLLKSLERADPVSYLPSLVPEVPRPKVNASDNKPATCCEDRAPESTPFSHATHTSESNYPARSSYIISRPRSQAELRSLIHPAIPHQRRVLTIGATYKSSGRDQMIFPHPSLAALVI